MSKTMAKENGISILKSLHRGEVAATETYQQAIECFVEVTDGRDDLLAIHAHHRDTANLLRRQIREMGGTPDQDSGVWGVWAKAIEKASTILGKTTAVEVLLAGEHVGLQTYQAAIEEPELSLKLRKLITKEIVPQTEQHIDKLHQVLKQT